MNQVRITCINKAGRDHDNPHEAISHYGWQNESNGKTGKSDRPSMVKWVEEGNKAFVRNENNIAYCGVKTSSRGTKFLQTYSDGEYNDNLLSLIECK